MKKLTFKTKERTPSPPEERKQAAPSGKIRMAVFEDVDSDSDNDDKPSPVKPIKAKAPSPKKEAEGGNFMANLAAMLAKGPPAQTRRQTAAPPTNNH